MTTETRPAGYHRAALVNALDGGMCDDCDSACPRCEKARTLVDRHAAEVRAAAFDEMAKKQASRAEADAIRRRHSIATARRLVAAELREEAAAARTDNTTGA